MGMRAWTFLLQGFGSLVPSLHGTVGMCSVVPPRVGLALLLKWGRKRDFCVFDLDSKEPPWHGGRERKPGKGSLFVGSSLGSPGPGNKVVTRDLPGTTTACS